jgi:hypothetical protein
MKQIRILPADGSHEKEETPAFSPNPAVMRSHFLIS